MGLTKRTESNVAYLEVKHFRLWRPLKQKVDGCDSVEVTNPKTGQKLTKFGFSYNSVTGHAVKMEKYDTEKKYSTRYFGFKLHLVDGGETFVIDMPYNSQILRRFLKVAPNIDWTLPLSLTIFKGKNKDGGEELGAWFQQRGATVKTYYNRDNPHGMPQPTHDSVEDTWDFKPQHRWLVGKLQEQTIPAIEAAAPKSLTAELDQYEEHVDESDMPPNSPIDDSETPF